MGGGVGAYISTKIKFSENDKLRLKIRDYENLWIDVPFPGKRNKQAYAIAMIYRHLCNNAKTFLDALDEKMQSLNQKRVKTVIMGDINWDLTSTTKPHRQSQTTLI